MNDVISRGSCPRLPVNLTRATKSALIDELQRAWAELAEARAQMLRLRAYGDPDLFKPTPAGRAARDALLEQ